MKGLLRLAGTCLLVCCLCGCGLFETPAPTPAVTVQKEMNVYQVAEILHAMPQKMGLNNFSGLLLAPIVARVEITEAPQEMFQFYGGRSHQMFLYNACTLALYQGLLPATPKLALYPGDKPLAGEYVLFLYPSPGGYSLFGGTRGQFLLADGLFTQQDIGAQAQSLTAGEIEGMFAQAG